MGKAIDLDLVEMRCRVRRWTLVRAPSTCPRPDAWVARDDHGIVVASHGYTLDYARQHGTALLIAPRWTVARLLSAPPAGWTADEVDDLGLTFFGWGSVPSDPIDGLSTYAVLVSINGHGRLVEPPKFLTTDIDTLAAANRALLELLAALAEIQAEDLKPYVVDDGCAYWVWARDADDARAVVVETYGTLDDYRKATGQDLDDIGVDDATEERLKGRLFTDEDGQKRPMSDEMRLNRERGVVAASEW